MIVKLILNLILVPIPSIGVNGAAVASVACHLVAFIISITALKRTIKLKLGIRRFIIKPILATIIMGICSYFIYSKQEIKMLPSGNKICMILEKLKIY